MLRKFLVISTFLTFVFNLFSQSQTDTSSVSDTITYWTFGGTTNLTFSQVHLENWSAGGEGSYSVNGLLDLSLDYKKDRLSWMNDLSASYGVIQQGEGETRKSDDNFDVTSKLGYRAVNEWYYYLLANFKTQFDEGFKYNEADEGTKISDFMSPAYINLSLGMEYKPDETFYILISPLTGKATFVLNDSLSDIGAYGVEPGDNFRSEFGASIKISYKKKLMENVKLSTKLELFSNLFEEFIKETDINWEVLVSMKINKFLSANIHTSLIYDDDIKSVDGTGPAIQFKEVFGLGLSYNF